MTPNESKTILIVGGDTGGHLFPGIALANRIKGRWRIKFFIGNRAVAREIMEKERFDFEVIPGCAFPGLNIQGYFQFAFINLKGIFRAYGIISLLKPSIVFSTGGYMSFPPVMAAWLKRIPVILHEQNLKPGLANRILSIFAGRIAVSFSDALEIFPPKKSFLSGNPVRQEILALSKKSIKSRQETGGGVRSVFNLLVFGGSQGSHFFNELMMDAAPLLRNVHEELHIIHVTGLVDFERVKKSYKKSGVYFEVYPFSHRMWELYGRADFVIARSGATTVAELIVLRKPALLVPFAAASGNHQYYNASYLAKKGCVVLDEEKCLEKNKLANIITGFIRNREFLEELKLGYELLPECSLDPAGVIEKEISKQS